eukprot:6437686-Lingulodinium_polyedra.AAC.1
MPHTTPSRCWQAETQAPRSGAAGRQDVFIISATSAAARLRRLCGDPATSKAMERFGAAGAD